MKKLHNIPYTIQQGEYEYHCKLTDVDLGEIPKIDQCVEAVVRAYFEDEDDETIATAISGYLGFGYVWLPDGERVIMDIAWGTDDHAVNSDISELMKDTDRESYAILFEELVKDVHDFQGNLPGLYSNDIDECCDLYVCAQAYLDMLQSSGNINRFLHGFHDYVRSRMTEIKSDQ